MGKVLLIAALALLLIPLLTVSAALGLPAETNLPVHNTSTGLGYATIQEAINAGATLDGHTIQVDAGTYHENVVVNKSVSLIGANMPDTIIDGLASGSILRIAANRVNITGFTIQNSMFGYSGIYLDRSNSDNITQNIVRNNYHGIYMYSSIGNSVTGNEVLGNEYGIHLYSSSNNTISGNAVSNNTNGIHLDISNNNTLAGNDVRSNTRNGIYLYGSNDNTLSGNQAYSNHGRGIRLHYSSANTLSNNVVLDNGYGIYLYGSEKNILSGNDASFNNESGILLQGSDKNTIVDSALSNNVYGIWLIDSDSNAVSGNNVTSNDEYGVRLWNSSRNVFFHNSFIDNSVKNVEQPGNTSLMNLWDNGAEGNYWGDYDSAATNIDGVGDIPYVVDERAFLGVYSQDSHPLLGRFLQFDAATMNQSYTVGVVSNSTIVSFQFLPGLDDQTNMISLRVSGTGGTGFCLISIPHVLVAPPYTVTVDQIPPLSYNVVRTNGTHTWVYLTYLHSEHELTVKPTIAPGVPIWSMWWFWGIFGLALTEAVLASFTIKYRRRAAEQTKLLQEYSPFVIAEALFKADIERRAQKISEFEKKYGVKIRPRSTLEDILRSLETKEEEEQT